MGPVGREARERLGSHVSKCCEDSSGDIDYVEFVDQLHRLKSQDQHTLLIFIMYYVKELQAPVMRVSPVASEEVRCDDSVVMVFRPQLLPSFSRCRGALAFCDV